MGVRFRLTAAALASALLALPIAAIVRETVVYLRELVASGARLHGASDPRFERVHVLVEG